MTKGLTDTQKQAVSHKDGAILILAGAGSGKTRVITSRIAALIESGIRPFNICAITFTNKAAEEMRQRVMAMNVPAGAHVSTFHSLCVRLLRQYGSRVGISSNFSIYDAADQKRCAKEAIKSCDIDIAQFTPGKMLGAISRLKNDLEDVDDVLEYANDFFTKIVAKVYQRYQKIMKTNNALDFDDLLVKTAFMLRDEPEVRNKISSYFRYILIDEYQDTNHAQYEIAKGLAIAHGNICVTGDPDQSIYRWRGADINNILAFENDWPDATVVKLEENFRSTAKILTMANKLIVANKKRKEKNLIPTRESGTDVIVKGFSDTTRETENIAERVKELIDQRVDLNTIAVFYRVNSMSRVIEEVFVQKQIPYQIVRGVEFYARKEIRDMLSYLKVIVNPDDEVALLRAINTHPRGIGKTTMDRLTAYASDNMLKLYEAMKHPESVYSIAKGACEKIKAFVSMIEQFKTLAEGQVGPLAEAIFETSGLRDALEAGGDKQQGAIENVIELINAACKYDDQTDEPSLVDYLQTIALYSDTDSYDADSGKVALMTLHAAKGLEFDNVFIVGLEEGLLPHERSKESIEELEEERRLFFVGITRARDNLNISYSRHRTMRGNFYRTVPSQFLYEIGYSPYEDFEDAGIEDSPDELCQDGAQLSEQGFAVNELVEHKKFGMGRVKEFMNLGENSIVVVRFNSGKTSSLMVKYANLTRVGK